jgi:MFS family permease
VPEVLARPLAAIRAVFANLNLRWLLLGWGGYYMVEWSYTVSLAVFAYQKGGAAAVGVVGLLRMLPAALVAPLGSWLGDRFRRDRVLMFIHLARGLALLASAAAAVGGASDLLVYALAIAFTAASAPFRAVHWAILPSLAEKTEELTASNLAASSIAGLGTLAGPALAGLLLTAAGPGLVFAAGALFALGAALLVSRVRMHGWGRARAHGAASGVFKQLLAGFGVLAAERDSRLMVMLFAAQTLVRGALTVLIVAAALDLLHLGQAGVGFLYSAMGAGAFLGVVTTLTLVGRRRLAAPFGLGLVLWGIPIALIGVWPAAWVAPLMLATVGIGNTLEDVAGFTLLQRTVPDRVLARLFGVFEGIISTAAGLGSITAPVLLWALGIRGALLATGAILPVGVLLAWRRLREIDAGTGVPELPLALLRQTALFAPLPIVTLERLARCLVALSLPAQAILVRQGEPGDRFYLLARGEVEALVDGRVTRTLAAGDHFGEIALLRDVPRTASVRTRTPVEVYALDREEFVAAVTGHEQSVAAVDAVITARLGGRPG